MGVNQGKQFNYEKRSTLENLLNQGKGAKEIAGIFLMDPTSIAREIKRNREALVPKDPGSICNGCLNYQNCNLHHRCGRQTCGLSCVGCKTLSSCDKLIKLDCRVDKRFPYCCNGCQREMTCRMGKYRYDASLSHKKARDRLVNSRTGLNLTPEEYEKIDSILFDAIKVKGQSIHHALVTNRKELKVSEKTIYKYVGSRKFRVRNIDLPRQPGLKKRKKIAGKYEYPENKGIVRTGHLYSDWLVFKFRGAARFHVQMDFLGKPHQSRQELLVLGIPDLSFILLYGCQDTVQATVISLFGDLERRLGIEGFKTLFPAILTDRDVKFDDFLSLEIDGNGEKRTHIFFCDPGASNQKAVVENLNSQLRAMFPKKAILDAYTQEELDEASSHFNSRFLSSIDDRTPIDLFASIFGKEMLERLHIKSIDPKEVKLKPIHR